MRKTILILAFLTAGGPFGFAAVKKTAKDTPAERDQPARIWMNPGNIRTRDLYYGPGGRQDAPGGVFVFVKEDLDGTNPKIVVRDRAGVRWKVKLGSEAKPETVASRLIWAVGYFADEDYFLPRIHVKDLPDRLRRGEQYRLPGDVLENARLKRYLKGEEKLGDWKWRDNPFLDTREFDGLRVVMALINNWDLKDVNNAVYQFRGRRIYLVSDLGASFGTNGRGLTHASSKGNLRNFEKSGFITREKKDEEVNFATPAHMTWFYVAEEPEFIHRLRMEWIGKDIPEEHVAWISNLLSRLSPVQIRAAFRAGGYSPEDAADFSQAVETRIHDLAQIRELTSGRELAMRR